MLSWLRKTLPSAYAFSVTELPYSTKLDQNEAPVDLPQDLKQELAAELAALAWNRYVQPAQYIAAKRGVASALGLEPDTIALTAGCDQAIEAAFLLGGGPGRRARIFEPTYPYLRHAAVRTGTEVDTAFLGAELGRRLTPEAISRPPLWDMVALVSPNNPTGSLVDEATVASALTDPGKLVFIDEAYADFSSHTHIPLVADHEQLLIGRSLSKSSLAGVHLGLAVGHPEAIAMIERMYTAPYHLNAMQLVVACRYIDIAQHVRAAAQAVIAERERVYRALATMHDIAPQPSRGNFLLFAVHGEPERANRVHAHLSRVGVRIRNVGGVVGLEGFLRVTIGMAAENDNFLQAVAEALGDTATEAPEPQ